MVQMDKLVVDDESLSASHHSQLDDIHQHNHPTSIFIPNSDVQHPNTPRFVWLDVRLGDIHLHPLARNHQRRGIFNPPVGNSYVENHIICHNHTSHTLPWKHNGFIVV